MKTYQRALFAACLAGAAGLASAGTLSVTPANATVQQLTGGPTSPTPHSISYAPAGGDLTNNLQGRLLYNQAILTAVTTDVGGNCNVSAPGTIIFLSSNNTANPLAAVTLCTIAFTAAPASPLGPTPLDLVFDMGQGDGCIDFPANPTACTLEDATVTVTLGTFNYAATPPALTFNGVVGVATATQNVNIAAEGGNTGPVTFTGCTFGGANPGDYAMSPAPVFPLNVAAGANVNIPIAFTAGALGARNADFSCQTANGTAVGGSFPITLNGTGVTNTLTTTPALAFPGTGNGSTSAPLNVTATAGAGNTGNVTITSCALGGANPGDFAQTPAVNNLVVAPGASVNFPVTFSPTAVGARSATLTCQMTNGPGASFDVALTGEGLDVAPNFVANPVTGTVINALGSAGTPIIRLVAFSNTGDAAGTMTCNVTGAGFTVGGSPLNLAIGASGNISITGSSLAPATLTGTLDCTGSNGQAFTYPLSFVFGAPIVTQIPALGGFGLWAMLGLFAGVGMFFAFRNRA